MMAAWQETGDTIIQNCAIEPEIADLRAFCGRQDFRYSVQEQILYSSKGQDAARRQPVLM